VGSWSTKMDLTKIAWDGKWMDFPKIVPNGGLCGDQSRNKGGASGALAPGAVHVGAQN
jgi:hypothetical protein